MSNATHSSFASVGVFPIPSNGEVPTTYAVTGKAYLPGLISATHDGPTHTKVDDTEQSSEAKEYTPGRAEPLTFNCKISYTKAKFAAWWDYLPEILSERDPDKNGRYIWDFVRGDGAILRTIGYLDIGSGDNPEDDRNTFDATVMGSGVPLLILPA